jgi:phosphocarrier protein
VFVMVAKRFAASIEVARAEGSDDWVDGRSILSLLSLAAGRGTRLRVRAEGADAADAVEALGALLEGREASPESAAGGGSAG